MPDNDFRQKLVDQIKEKKKEKQRVEQQRFEVQSQLRALDDELRELETSLSVHDRLMGITSPIPSTAHSNAKRFRNATAADSCATLMRELGGEAATRELMERLTKAGKLKAGYKTNYTTVLKALQRDERFEWVSRGRYRLKEYQPQIQEGQ